MVTRPNPKLTPYVATAAIVAICGLLVVDLWQQERFNATVIYPTILLACWWARDRRVLWTLCILSILCTIGAQWMESHDHRSLLHRILLVIGLLVTTVIFDHLLQAWDEMIHRQDALEASVAEVAAREEEIARQNEELQSQTEELERQREELSVSNDELARRERSLGVLLELSRDLSIDMPLNEAMSRICQTLHTLLDDGDTATAILEIKGNALHVRCHHGFGPDGPESPTLSADHSFAALVCSLGRTGYLDDLSLRPELKIPQPRSGAPFASIISAPFRIDGKLVGTVEAFTRHRRAWTAEEVNLIESMASQTAATIHSDNLFEDVAHERRKFEAIFSTAPVGMALIEAGATTIRFNPTGASLLGVPADSPMEQADFLRRVHLYKAGVEQHQLQSTLPLTMGQDISGQEIEILLPSGRRLSLLYSVAAIRDGTGQTSGSVSAFIDVTPLKDLQRELDVRRREAEEANVRKTRFLAAVSHDVRTPANAISLLAELIRRTAAQPDRQSEIVDLAQELHSSSMAMVNLLGDVLDITRFDAGRIELQESEFNLGALLAMECQHLMPLARQKNLDFRLVDGTDAWLRCDKIKLARMIGNLAGNAIKFTSAGQIQISYSINDSRLHIAVSDTGIGIAPEHTATIFDEFFQLRNPERDRNKGNGLGLTICKRLADAMGASLTVQSEPGRGSTFTVVLPPSAIIARP
jgi:PAS domain S-box-containing protein